jgi:hypothetical protein
MARRRAPATAIVLIVATIIRESVSCRRKESVSLLPVLLARRKSVAGEDAWLLSPIAEGTFLAFTQMA